MAPVSRDLYIKSRQVVDLSQILRLCIRHAVAHACTWFIAVSSRPEVIILWDECSPPGPKGLGPGFWSADGPKEILLWV